MSTSPWYLADKSLSHDFSVVSHFPDLIISETELLIPTDSGYPLTLSRVIFAVNITARLENLI